MLLSNRIEWVENGVYRFRPPISSSPEEIERRPSLFEQGQAAHRRDDYQGALVKYRKVPWDDPNIVKALVNEAEILIHYKNFRDAEDICREALKINPLYAQAYFNLALIYEERPSPREAINFYLKALEVDRRYGDAYYNLGVLYRKHNQWHKAIQYFEWYLGCPIEDDNKDRILARAAIHKMKAQIETFRNRFSLIPRRA